MFSFFNFPVFCFSDFSPAPLPECWDYWQRLNQTKEKMTVKVWIQSITDFGKTGWNSTAVTFSGLKSKLLFLEKILSCDLINVLLKECSDWLMTPSRVSSQRANPWRKKNIHDERPAPSYCYLYQETLTEENIKWVFALKRLHSGASSSEIH